MYWTSWKPNKMRFPKQHQRKKGNVEFYQKIFFWLTLKVLPSDKNFDELLCILMKMFGRGCIKYDNGNLSSNFWIGFASSLSLNQMLPAALLFKDKMHLNLLLAWNSLPCIKWLPWQIAFQRYLQMEDSAKRHQRHFFRVLLAVTQIKILQAQQI